MLAAMSIAMPIWTVADAQEVELRMTLNPAWLESDDYKLGHLAFNCAPDEDQPPTQEILEAAGS
jgi:hypothetical protein